MKEPSDINTPTELAALGVSIERLPGETADGYQAFLHYVSLRGGSRNTKKVARDTGYSELSTNHWSGQFNWQERAAAVDAQRWLIEEQHRQELAKKDNQEFVAENRKIKQKSITVANTMLDVAQKLLQSALAADEVRHTGEVETKDGQMVPTYTEIKMKSKVSDIPRLADTGVKIARLAADLPTEIIDDVTRRIPASADLSEMTMEQLEALQEENREILMREKGIQTIGVVD